LHPLAFDGDAGEEWKRHAELGFAAAREQLDPSAAAVVLNHHQHFDGSSDKDIFARIASVADTFHHLLHRDGIAQPTLLALCEMQREPMRNWFDPVIFSALLELVPPFVPGMVVMLSDRRLAVVSKVREDLPCYPEVQVLAAWAEDADGKREVIDLSTIPEFHVAEIDGFAVGQQLFGPRKIEGSRHVAPPVEQVVVNV
ncbi:MAG: hypothetical protein FWD53_11485, partial [Phycisphaerales bacterium]|nr:hypothetical protein [Phycisphaerales bacterium]